MDDAGGIVMWPAGIGWFTVGTLMRKANKVKEKERKQIPRVNAKASCT